jgi:Protein of unknown function (DUF2752)
MSKTQKIIAATCLLGYFLVYQAIQHNAKPNCNNIEIGFCLFKKATTLPCPACGTTTAFLLLLKGEIRNAVLKNPFVIFVFLYLLIAPFWLLYDILFKQKTIDKYYNKAQLFLSKKIPLTIFFILVILNWIWNIKKGL